MIRLFVMAAAMAASEGQTPDHRGNPNPNPNPNPNVVHTIRIHKIIIVVVRNPESEFGLRKLLACLIGKNY